jgi:hypothetical protein
MTTENSRIRDTVTYELRGPDGKVKAETAPDDEDQAQADPGQ